jgi:hypothetical protein
MTAPILPSSFQKYAPEKLQFFAREICRFPTRFLEKNGSPQGAADHG